MGAARQAIRRLYWVDAILQRGDRPNASRLARDVGVSRSTIHRDLAALREEFKAPIIYDPEVGGFLYGHAFVPDLPQLSAEEALELAQVLRRGGTLAGTALERSLLGLQESLLQLLAAPGAGASSPPSRGGADEPVRSAELGRLRRLPAGERPARAKGERAPLTSVVVRFDRSAGEELLRAGLLRREEVQLLTDGGIETTLGSRDPDALLLDLLPWAPHFEIASPPWVRRRLPGLLRRLLRTWERPRPRRRRA
jgi:predicted DNA-binding transcriptional regulator YafY